jgi:hypothetical protein
MLTLGVKSAARGRPIRMQAEPNRNSYRRRTRRRRFTVQGRRCSAEPVIDAGATVSLRQVLINAVAD